MDGDFIEVHITLDPPEPGREILIAHLAQLPFDSVLETEDGLKAYIPEAGWKKNFSDILEGISIPGTRLDYAISTIRSQNWNAIWEAGFEPIQVGEHCYIRAPFHPKSTAQYDIEIMPKMSFGTGHHETTHLMLELLLDEEVRGKNVLDMGCGTGVLAILACMMKAKEVHAIDIDSWSYRNTLENSRRNTCGTIKTAQGDASILASLPKFDVILANINKNILLADIPSYVLQLNPGGVLALSGFFLEDLRDIDLKCQEVGLRQEKFHRKNNWVAAKYVI